MGGRRRVWVWVWVSIGLILAFLLIFQNNSRSVAVSPEPGFAAPNFTLQDTQGHTVSLSQLRGKLVYVNFWASWCPPCQEETPDLVKMYAEYGKRIAFIGINLTGSDKVANALGFIQYFHIAYPVLLDSKDTAAKMYNILAIPTSFFINRQGIIVDRVTGAMPLGIMKQDFEHLAQS